MFGLRRATSGDARFVWEVNNEPSVRARSVDTADIPWESHAVWYERKLVDPRAVLFVGTVGGTPAGICRFDVIEREAVVGVALGSAFRGRGLGQWLIASATAELFRLQPVERVRAAIRPDNVGSLRAFAAAGYVLSGTEEQSGVALETWICDRSGVRSPPSEASGTVPRS